MYSSQASIVVSNAKVLKPEVLQIINLVHDDQFSLKSIDTIFGLIKHIFTDDEEYFHIIPQLFIQYFWNNTFSLNRPILDIENELLKMIKTISAKESSGQPVGNGAPSINIKMKNFNPPSDYKVNLFKDTAYFGNY